MSVAQEIQDRLDELQDELDAWEQSSEEYNDAVGNVELMADPAYTPPEQPHPYDRDHIIEERAKIEALVEEIEGYAGERLKHVHLISEYDFEDHAEELAEDIGAIDRNATWPLNHIDWTAAADALKADYHCIEWDGTDYYFRMG